MSLLLAPPPLRLSKARAADPFPHAAQSAEPRVRRVWREVWQSFQAALPELWGLSSLPTILREAWQMYGLPHAQDLQEVLQRLAVVVARGPLPALPADALGIALAVQAIETSLAQVPTTMARVPQALLPEVAVLTIPQQNVLARMAEGLAAEPALKPAHVERTLRTQARAQLKQRTDNIARQLTWQAAQAGQQAGWEQQAQAGTLGVGARRYWVLASSACVERCAPVPGMNPKGVGVFEPFHTPIGDVMGPTLHPHCRCDVRVG